MPQPGVVSIDAISVAWRIISSDWGTWILASLLVAAISFALGLVFAPIQNMIAYGGPLGPKPGTPPDPRAIYVSLGAGIPFNIINGTLSFILTAGLMEMAMRKLEGRPTNAGDALLGFNRAGDLIVAGLLYSIATIIGTYLCILPGLIAAALFAFAPLLIMRQNMRGVDALTASARILQPQMWMMVGVVFLAILLTMLGVCACCIGIIFTMPIFSVTVAVIYSSFFPPIQAQPYASQPPGNMPPTGYVPPSEDVAPPSGGPTEPPPQV